MSTRGHSPSTQGGFTIIEVMVAMMLLLVGMLGTIALVDRAEEATASTRAREGGTTLAREVVEQARAVPFTDLSTAALTPALQAIPGLANAGSPGTWTIRRRQITYTVVAEVCAIDDPRDGLGDHVDGGYCPGGGTGTVDPGPKDFKQISARVSYTFKGAAREVKITTLVSTNGSADAPAMTDLKTTTPTFTDPREPIVTQPIGTVSQVVFEADSTSAATKVIWSVEGLDKGSLLKTNPAQYLGNNKWRFTVPLAGMVDGDYAIGVRGVDSNGAEGAVREVPLRLVRGPSAAVTALVGGPNSVRVSGSPVNAVELEWLQSPEKNVYGYRTYRETGTNTNVWTLICPAASSTLDKSASCVDQNPVYARYRVIPVYQNAAGNMVESTNIATVGPVSPPGPAALFLSSVTAGSTTYCNPTSRNLTTSSPTGTDVNAPIGSIGAFCTTAGTTMGFLAGPSVAHLWLQNTHNGQDCTFTLNLNAVGPAGTTPVGSRAVTVPNRTNTPVRFDAPITHSAFIVGSTSRLVLSASNTNGNGCGSTTLHAGSSAYVSSIDLPGAGSPPNPPTGLTAVRNANGSVDLAWTAPASGPTVGFYRIYRGGTNVTNRIDRTGSATPTSFVDAKPPANSSYYVTSVTPTLGESAPVGPIVG